MRGFLEPKGVGGEAIEHALGELAEAGFLDDERFAQRFAEDKRALESWGGERIERELLRRGVPPDVVEAELACHGRDDELRAAVGLLAERSPALDGDRDRDRAWRLLVRKGYEPELAYDALREHARG